MLNISQFCIYMSISFCIYICIRKIPGGSWIELEELYLYLYLYYIVGYLGAAGLVELVEISARNVTVTQVTSKITFCIEMRYLLGR